MTASPSADRQAPGNLPARGPGIADRAPSAFGDVRAPTVTDEMVGKQRPRIEHLAAALAGQMAQRGEADLVDDFALPLAYAAVCDLIGISPQDRKRLHDWSQEWRVFLLKGEPDERRSAARRAVYDHMSGLLADRLENPQDDLCTRLAVASRDGQLPAHEAIAAAARTLLNGYPNPAGFISSMLLGLLLDPGTCERLVQQPVLIPAVVEEFLRSLDRRGNGNDPFGHGHRYCPGAALARLEAQAAVAAMLPHLGEITLAVPVENLALSNTRFGNPTALECCPVTWPHPR